MEKKINRWLIITLAAAAIFGALAFVSRNSEHDSAATGDLHYTVCDYIDIDLAKLNAEIIPYDGDDIRIAYKNNLPLIITTDDNKISIAEDDRFVISIFPGESTDFGLYVYLPKRSYREISVYTGPGSVKTGRVDARLLTILTESGDITCRDTVSTFNISTTSGNTLLDVEAVMRNSSILSRRGDVELLVPKNSSMAVSFETQSGACVPEITGGKPAGNGIYGINGGARQIYAAVGEGTLTIKKRD